MIGYINKMEPMYIEIKSIRNMRTPKKGLGTRAEVTGITKEQHKILQGMAWHLSDGGYFQTNMTVDGRRLKVSLHQAVNNMRYSIEPIWDNTYVEYCLEIDHIDTNTLNCRPDNLTYLTDLMNKSRKSKKGKSSRYYGVSWDKQHKKWQAHYALNGKKKHVGYYQTEEEAGRARDAKVRELGLDVMINFP
jgi:hypothetical protein